MHDLEDVNDGLSLIDVFLEELGFELREILLFLETLDSLLLVIFDSAHFLPDLIFFVGEFRLFSLLVQLGEVLVYALVERLVFKDGFSSELLKRNGSKIF